MQQEHNLIYSYDSNNPSYYYNKKHDLIVSITYLQGNINTGSISHKLGVGRFVI